MPPRPALQPRSTPLNIAPAVAQGKNVWGGTTFQAFSRFLMCIFFILSAVSRVHSFDKETGGPVMSWFGPKLDIFFAGLSLKPFKAMYPQILLLFSAVEFLGAVLFASDIRFGAWLLVIVTAFLSVIIHNFWDYQHRPPVMQNELAHFVKNVAIVGGLLHYLATTPGTRHKSRYERTMDALRAETVAQVMEARAARAAAGNPQETESHAEDKKDQ